MHSDWLTGRSGKTIPDIGIGHATAGGAECGAAESRGPRLMRRKRTRTTRQEEEEEEEEVEAKKTR